MTPPEPIPAAQLLAESAWLERLARRLVAEPAAAADATQEAFTKALTRSPGAGVPLRSWLATILRNVVRQGRRAEQRRARRELERTEVERVAEPADELAARLELHARLVAAVRSLEEPYRTTVALRFLEDLAPTDVAERMGVPLKTVHTRLERALERLRARLDRDYGRREAWLALLLPHFGLPPVALPDPSPLVPLLAMGTLWKWTGAATLLATLGFVAFRTLSSPAERLAAVHDKSGAPPAAELAPASSAPAMSLADAAREVVRPVTPPATTPSSTPDEPALETLSGFVRDIERRPIGGLNVEYEAIRATPSAHVDSGEPAGRAQSEADGRFELPVPQALCRIVAGGRGYATLVAPTLMGARLPEPPVVYVGPERAYSGLAVDALGNPLSGVELTLSLAEALARELVTGTLAAALPIAHTSSASDGSFLFPPVGGAPGSTLDARADGFESASLLLPEDSSDELLVTLTRSARPDGLAGHVRHADGRPAAGAHVSTGEASVRCDESGAFELPLEAGAKAERVHAVLRGFQPATLELAGATTGMHRELELVLGGPALALGGRVEDAQGRPLPGAQVWTSDGERFGDIPTRLGEMTLLVGFDFEGVIAGAEDQTGGREATTDAEGRFELASLLERSYDLYALDARTNELAGPVAARAGTSSTVLRLAGETRTRVAGRVLSLSGEPQAGVQVAALRSVRRPDGSRGSHARGSLRRTTDAEGRFAFEELCTEGTELSATRADSPVSTSLDLAREPDLAALELRLAAACHVRILLDDPSRASGVELHDERDQALDVTLQVGGVYMTSKAIFVKGGVSDVLVTDERARTLVLWKDGQESERIPLHLVPGQVNEVRP